MKTLKLKSFNMALAAVSAAAGLLLATSPAMAAFSFLGVAAGDVSDVDATVWTRAADDTTPVSVTLTLQVSTDQTFATGVLTKNNLPVTGATDANNDYTLKIDFTGLSASTVYFYRFYEPNSNTYSITGKFKTAPSASASVPVHFAFSGDNDGLMRPYALASQIPAENLDFYMNLGDVIYENASNLTSSGTHNGASYLNSPSVTLSNDDIKFDGIPRAGTTFATQAQLKADYAKKYRENFLPVNTNGQNSLQVLYAAQGNYTTWDNHELGNRKYIDGGAPAGGSVGGASGNDMATGRGVDARAYTGTNNGGSGNVNNVNDVNTSSLATGDFMNRATGFQTLQNVFLAYQPIADRGTVDNNLDPRSHGTKKLYSAQQWGKNAIHIVLDTRSYRDIRLKTANAGADDTGSRADNTGRTYLGATQLQWLKNTLGAAQSAGTTWKFISISDPIDQIGPIGTSLSGVTGGTGGTMNTYSGNSAYGPVNSDGGKAYFGGYRAERNALLKYIVDNNINNVVFLATDDHQNRINELYYSPSGIVGPGSTGAGSMTTAQIQAQYVKVPNCFSIVCGPLGATGPDLFLNHGYSSIQGAANLIANAQISAGVDPIGLAPTFPGLHDVMRDKGNGLVQAGTIEPATFYSPDTFNYTVLDVSADGRTLSVKSVGMNSTATNAGTEYSAGPQARTIFSFKVDAFVNPQITASGFTFNRALNKFVQTLTVKNIGTAAVVGPIHVVLSNVSVGTTLANPTGTTTTGGNPFVTVSNTNLAVGSSVTYQLRFTPPSSGGITYTPQAVTGVANP